MPVNNFNVGKDVTFVIFDANQNEIINFSIVTGFDRKQETTEVKVKGIDGVVRYAFLNDGWSGTIELDRADRQCEDFFANMEALYYAGVNVLGGQITETTTEVDGSISQYQLQRVVYALEDAGKVAGDAAIKMKIKWAASFRKKVV